MNWFREPYTGQQLFYTDNTAFTGPSHLLSTPFPLCTSTKSPLRSSDVKNQVRGILLNTQTPTCDLIPKEARIFQSQVSTSATFDNIRMLRRELSSLPAQY